MEVGLHRADQTENANGQAGNAREGLPARLGRANSRWWPKDKEDALRKHVCQGLSGTAIAMLLGITKNAVIGKIHRTPNLWAQWSRATVNVKPEQRFEVRDARITLRRALRTQQTVAPAPTIVTSGITFMDLHARSCRYPLWDRYCRDHIDLNHYCGETTIHVRLPYCLHHCKVSYEPASRKR